MKRTRLNTIKAVIRKYRMKNNNAKQAMFSGDLSAYIQRLAEVEEQRVTLKQNLLPVSIIS